MLVLCIEYLAEMLRMSEMFQGFKIEKQCLKVSLCADDTVVYLNDNSS